MEGKIFIERSEGMIPVPENMVLIDSDELENFKALSKLAVLTDGMVWVDKDQLNTLIATNQEYKADIIALVGIFKGFAGMLSGKSGIGAVIGLVTKLMNNKTELDKIAAIVPVIEKYTESNGKAE